MAEIMYILTILYFVYVIRHVVINGRQEAKEDSHSRSNHSASNTQAAEVIENATSKNQKAGLTKSSNELRNPETGEVTKIFNNYQMNKRWIKQVMVDEGLLEKIYKTKEIDDAAKSKISVALEQLKNMDKYQ